MEYKFQTITEREIIEEAIESLKEKWFKKFKMIHIDAESYKDMGREDKKMEIISKKVAELKMYLLELDMKER